MDSFAHQIFLLRKVSLLIFFTDTEVELIHFNIPAGSVTGVTLNCFAHCIIVFHLLSALNHSYFLLLAFSGAQLCVATLRLQIVMLFDFYPPREYSYFRVGN